MARNYRVTEARLERVPADPVAAAYDAVAAGKGDMAALALLKDVAAGGGDGEVLKPTGAEVSAWLREGNVRAHEAIRRLLAEADLDGGLDVVAEHVPNPPPVPWLVDGWMPEATISVLTGAAGAGKSRIAMQLAVAVAQGGGSFIKPSGGAGRLSELSAPPVRVEADPGRVVFAAWETRRLAWANRLAAVVGQDGDRTRRFARLTGQLLYVNMRPEGGLWGVDRGERLRAAGGWLPGGWSLLTYAEHLEARLLIIDPLAKAYVSNENDRSQVRAFLSALDEWAESTNCTVLLISHPAKSGDTPSGSTDWKNGVQAVWTLTAGEIKRTPPDGGRPRLMSDPEIRCLRVERLNEGPIPAPVYVCFDGDRFVEVEKPASESGGLGLVGPDTLSGLNREDLGI